MAGTGEVAGFAPGARITSPNQAYREDLRELGECRDREAPLLASERNFARCGVCRAKRAVAKGAKRGYSAQGMAQVQARLREAVQVRIEVLGHDDGAGDRETVRRLWAA